jgi:formylglycine-generating enzyme required for sulfatase activity
MRGRAISLGGLVLAASVFTMGSTCVAEVDPAVSCADLNGDEAVNVGDPVVLLRWLFLGGPAPPCPGVSGTCGDVNADGEAELGDVQCLLGWLFLGDEEITCSAGCENAGAPDIEGFTFVGCNAEGYPEYTHDGTGIVFVRLPGGTFNMGSPEEEPYHSDNEGPVHEVTLSPFLIAKYEVTQGEWHAVMGNYPSYFDGTKDSVGDPVDPPDDRDVLPVEQVSWDDIQEFEETTGLTLPTEAEWEYACRGGTETAFSFGSGESCADWECEPCAERDPYMWYCGNAENRTHPVGTKLANPFGLHDMHGNVWEWCEDVWSSSFYSTPEAAGPDPLCTSGSGFRVIRGGLWVSSAWYCRSAYRYWVSPGYRVGDLGFRPAGRHPQR